MHVSEMTPKQAREAIADALESGRFTQGKGRLNHNNTLCCLGVSCEIYIKCGGKLKKESKANENIAYGNEGNIITLPTEVQDWLGFKTPFGSFKYMKEHHSLTALNDNGTPFPEIAKLFRHPPTGLLKHETGQNN